MTTVSGESSKRITPNLGFSLEGEWLGLDKDGKQDHSGLGNLELALKLDDLFPAAIGRPLFGNR